MARIMMHSGYLTKEGVWFGEEDHISMSKLL